MSFPDADLIHLWEKRGAVEPLRRWKPLTGGNTNALWQVGDRVVKLYRPEAETPLFANDPKSERVVLRALAGTGLVPEFVAAEGDSLVYKLAEGRGWQPEDGMACVAETLAGLHAMAPPEGIPDKPVGKDALVRQTLALGEDVPVVPDEVPRADKVFIHGDATAANALVSDGGVTFIDWQCPGVGDACDDIAVFLSPAMQVISGNRPLTENEVDTFLAAYGEGDVTERYRALRPLYQARMRGYCRWRAARGDDGYGKASLLER
ncbi:aminoglycoside phosphotransferase family protein [Maritimibacter sp. UBA3975]|uniref:aminoglycoside phosphotransferase family protein n=1 Tax=Maritimibacter sp. UBA3975 TaxID=1946833 RepID=UPI000C09D7E5|nr:aminoglycoside phosphotransferase family protein [Maritimibacter sp. UBA3975]MAM63549.1 aminoglycoside phosphotransferase [Maritimibacter sp.]